MHAAVNLTERARGTVSPASLTFLASNWAQPQARIAPVYQLDLREKYSLDKAGSLLKQLQDCVKP